MQPNIVFTSREWLKEIRETKRITTARAGELSKITQSYYSQIENGRHKVPVKTAKAIAAALGFDWQRFYEE